MGSSDEDKPELQNRDDVGIVIGAHVPIAVEKPGSLGGWSPIARVTEEAFLAKLHGYAELAVRLSSEMQAKLSGLRA
jgi:hypothetical protein